MAIFKLATVDSLPKTRTNSVDHLFFGWNNSQLYKHYLFEPHDTTSKAIFISNVQQSATRELQNRCKWVYFIPRSSTVSGRSLLQNTYLPWKRERSISAGLLCPAPDPTPIPISTSRTANGLFTNSRESTFPHMLSVTI